MKVYGIKIYVYSIPLKKDLLIYGIVDNIIIDFLSNSSLRPLIIFEYLHIKNDIFDKLVNILISKNFVFYKLEENIICFPKENENLKELL